MTTDIQLFDLNVDLLRASLWQYDSATTLQSLLNQKKEWYDVNYTAFWNDWITNVFNLNTANDFGLSVWAIILNQSIYTDYPAFETEVVWGLNDVTDVNENFDNGSFPSEGVQYDTYTTEVARTLLKLRYFQLVSSGTVPETNRMLKYVFADYGNMYLIDNFDMTQTYVIDFAISDEMRYMLNNTDILPRPATVGQQIAKLDELCFGFGSFNLGFDQGSFVKET